MNRIGRYRHRIQLYSATETRTAGGGVTRTWALQDVVWGRVTPISGDEKYNGDQVHSDVTHIIRIRYRHGVKASWRIVQADHIFQIRAVIEEDHIHDEMILHCTEQATGNQEVVLVNDDNLPVYNDDGASILVGA